MSGVRLNTDEEVDHSKIELTDIQNLLHQERCKVRDLTQELEKCKMELEQMRGAQEKNNSANIALLSQDKEAVINHEALSAFCIDSQNLYRRDKDHGVDMRTLKTHRSGKAAITPVSEASNGDNATDEKNNHVIISTYVESAENDSIPRSRGGNAMRPRKGHFVILRPQLGEIRFYDVPVLKDRIMNVDDDGKTTFHFQILNKLFWYFGVPFTFICGAFCPLYGPFAILSFTDASRLLLDGSFKDKSYGQTNATSMANMTKMEMCATAKSPLPPWCAWEPAWGYAWEEACWWMMAIQCFALFYVTIYSSLDIHPAVWKVTMKERKTQVFMALRLSVVYSIAAGSLLPNFVHICWLIMRMSCVWWALILDSYFVTRKLRQSAKSLAKMHGSHKAGRGWVSNGIILFTFTILFIDVLRHLLVLFVSPKIYLIQFGFANPLTGNRLSLTNHQVADGCFYTNLLLLWRICSTIMRSHLGSETVLLTTKYSFILPGKKAK